MEGYLEWGTRARNVPGWKPLAGMGGWSSWGYTRVVDPEGKHTHFPHFIGAYYGDDGDWHTIAVPLSDFAIDPHDPGSIGCLRKLWGFKYEFGGVNIYQADYASDPDAEDMFDGDWVVEGQGSYEEFASTDEGLALITGAEALGRWPNG